MSRVAKKPISLPKGVECVVGADSIAVKGPKGTLSTPRHLSIDVKIDNGVLQLSAGADNMAMAGTLRALLSNMVSGVTTGYERKLELVGVGYRAAMAGKDLNLSLGFSHPVLFSPPAGVTIETPTQTEILIKGADKQVVGQAAAKIRAFRSPEPYKGKGVRYAGEKITLKEAKKA
jgi:large subunit ribosomal protein L6